MSTVFAFCSEKDCRTTKSNIKIQSGFTYHLASIKSLSKELKTRVGKYCFQVKTFKTDENHGKLCPMKGKTVLKTGITSSSTYCGEISDLVLPSFTVFRHLDREFRPLFVTQCEIGWQLPSNSEKRRWKI